MARRMSLTPADFRKTMAVAVLDDLWHGQPELENRPVTRQADDGTVFTVYEVRGFIDPDKLGAFGAQQLERVMEHRHPGLLAQLNGTGPASIGVADIFTVLEEVGLPGDPYHREQAAAVARLITDRLPYQPNFNDL